MNMKKTASLLLAVVLLIALGATAMAATVENATMHSYDAYQIFSGTQAADSSALGDVQWGTGVNGDALLLTLKADYDYFDSCGTAADVANVLKNKADGCDEAKALANAAAKNLTTTKVSISADAASVELAAGYYLLVDTSNVNGANDARNSALLQVTNKGNVTIAKKYSVPSVDKDIIEGGNAVEATDKNIGDTVDFQLTGTLPSNYADYETYKYVFHDTLSAGLTYNNNAKVYAVNNGVKTDVTDSFTIAYANTSLTISCDNLKALTGITADTKIVVEYSATLNSNAVIGSAGNPNKVKLEYTNDPNHSGEGTPTTGETPEDEVIVFTYELDVNKVDADNDQIKLSGAEFKLHNAAGKWVTVDANGKVTGWVDNEAGGSTLTSGTDGLFKVIGLDAGTYYLKETKAPAGYNLLTEEIMVVITATLDTSEDHPALSALTIQVGEDGAATNGNVTTGIVSMDVKNNKGATLPETGGMGTTILYIAGGVLVAAAVILLITRRRMNAQE